MNGSYEFLIFKKKINVKNINTGECYFFLFKQKFFSGNFEIKNPINGNTYTLHNVEKFLGLFGENEFTIIGEDLNLRITNKQSLTNLKYELYDSINHINLVYSDDGYYHINKFGIQIGKLEIISKFDPIFAISKLIFKLYLVDDCLDIKNFIFYSMCFKILMSSDSSD